MSYNTFYNLSIAEGGPNTEAVAAVIAELEGDTGSTNIMFWDTVLNGEADAKWYDSDEHMREVSRLWPGVLFTLNGTGEEQGDVWTAYYLGGMGVTHRQPAWEPPAFNPMDLTGGEPASQAKTYDIALKQKFAAAGDLNEADSHPFNDSVDDLCGMRNVGHHTLKVETVMADDLDAFVRFGDGTMLWFDYTGQTVQFSRIA